MKNSVSDHGLFIDSDEDDEEKELGIKDNDDNESDDSNDSNDNRPQRKPSSYSLAWPQSYRQSIDLYGSVPSPNIGFLGNASLSRLGSSFLASTLTRRHSPEIIPSVKKPLLQPTTDEQKGRSSQALLPPLPSRRSSIKKDVSKISHEVHIPGQCTFGQAVLNGINALCGVGILSTPYALKEGGWAALSILMIFAIFSFYTGLLLRYCLDSEPGLETYPDIGQAAFGTTGRVIISIILYMELYACCIEYIILESDNLSSLFPNAHFSFGGIEMNAHILFAILTTLAILPTVWLRDLRILSYISACGVIATIIVVLCLLWVGVVDDVPIHIKGTTTLNLSTFPVAMGLYGYCFAGHAVFPNLYTSMANRNQFPAVLLTCFAICTTMYFTVAVMGYSMYGETTLSQYTLNMPRGLVASKIAVWTTVVNPFTKYALNIAPVAMSLEELIPSNNSNFQFYSICIRTALVVSTLLVGLSVPFFGLVMSLIGSLLTMFVSLILPAACFLSIKNGRISRSQVALCVVVIIVGFVSCGFGSYSAISEIIEQLIR